MVISIAVWVVYFIVLLGIGVVASYRIRHYLDYISGNRKFNSFLVAFGIGAADSSGWILMGLPGLAYVNPTGSVVLIIVLLLGNFLSWSLLASKLRSLFVLSRRDNCTFADLLVNLLPGNNSGVRVITVVTLIFFGIFYIVGNIIAASFLLNMLFDVNVRFAVLFVSLVVLVFILLGGVIGVLWSDLMQSLLMSFALLLVPFLAFYWGNVDIFNTFSMIKNHFIGNSHSLTLLAWFSFLSWGLGYFGQPHILSRFLFIDDHTKIRVAKFISVFWLFLCLSGAVVSGVLGRVLYPHLITNPELVFISLTTYLLVPWLAALCLAAIWAAVMSTINAHLVVITGVFSHDLLVLFDMHRILSQDNMLSRNIGRIATIGVIVVCIFLSLFFIDCTVMSLVSFAWAGFGAVFGPLVLLSVYQKQYITNLGVVVSMLLAFFIVVFMRVLQWNSYIYELPVGFILSIFCFYLCYCIKKYLKSL